MMRSNTVTIPDQVFNSDLGQWKIAVGGVVQPEVYASPASAHAALAEAQETQHLIERAESAYAGERK